jgi:2-methylcitrate dehydratase PrpD
MGIAQALAERVVATNFASLPAEAVRWAKISILDTIGVAVAGTGEPAATLLAQVAIHSTGPSTLWCTTRRVSALDAALANGTAVHALDFDASSGVFAGHPSIHLVPSLFAVAEERDASGRDFIAAYCAGFEAQLRLARLVHPGHVRRGWFPASTIGVFGAAAACANLSRLDTAQTAQALSLAAMTSAGVMAHAGTMTKPMAAGQAARNGVLAAALASVGFTAAEDGIGGRRGFIDVLGEANGKDTAAVLADWGKPYDVCETARNLKRYPCCGVNQSSIDLAVDLVRLDKIDVRSIRSVDVQLMTSRLAHVDRPRPASGVDAKFSIQYCVAVALEKGNLGIDDFRDPIVLSPARQDLMDRIIVSVDPALTPDTPRTNEGGSRITVTLKDGSNLTRSIKQPVGRVPGQPLPDSSIDGKFIDCCRSRLGSERTASLLENLRNLETVSSLRAVGALLTADSGDRL